MAAVTPPVLDAVDELTQLLVAAQARTRLNRGRLTRSTLYDTRYHTAIIACALDARGEGPSHRLLTPWLKLLQFLAARPTLVDRFFDYVRDRRENSFASWAQMPRGYLGDQTHDGVVDLLVAGSILRKSGDYVEASTRYSVLEELARRIEKDDLFIGERAIIARLGEVKVTKALLGAA